MDLGRSLGEREGCGGLAICFQSTCTLPVVKTLDYAGVCIQAREVGGDYYDFLALGEDRLGLVVGDIDGKGIAAALLMANLQATLRSQCATALDEPLRIFHIVNQLFCENTTDSKYATLFFAEYDGKLRRLRYINCAISQNE
jgi:serine phosphatase RsbU (regulator of sigma subunit)